ncbi:Oxidoreductase [Acidilobus saccharovorans 345-15]|uniref:Oxidoreductase n=1 Tax=Acidilobus saccharovorans (strain DSM 16705 / JCM 18335 / VKM B-2471 / 345-15) TaxID=666510 RepID=D9Q282_ACIS3|nr:aldo/keto reductase [Acidilobus saccharovorans]ADL19420.1 Oxidoreductase [Acidilobus saccharovorans 345-15]
MNYRRLPNGLEVSELGVGVWSLVTDEWGADTSIAEDIIKEALNLGINFFDTADVYGRGRGEEILHRSLGPKISNVVILTKIGLDFYGCGGVKPNFNVDYLRVALSRSLERLGVGYVDILMLHNPVMNVIKSRDVFEFLREVKRSGEAKMVGVALGPTLGWGEEGKAAVYMGYEALEHIFNAIEQLPGLELLKFDGVAQFIRVPHASDVLDEERWPLKQSPSLHRSLKSYSWIQRALAESKGLEDIANRAGLKLYELALKYVLAYENVSSVLPNITSRHDLQRFVNAVEKPPLDKSAVEEVLSYWKSHLLDLNYESINETDRFKRQE